MTASAILFFFHPFCHPSLPLPLSLCLAVSLSNHLNREPMTITCSIMKECIPFTVSSEWSIASKTPQQMSNTTIQEK